MVKLKELFDIRMGNKLDMNKMSNGEINFIGRSSLNNGVTGKVSLIDDLSPFSSGLITVALGGSVLSSFVQLNPFYTGQNVAVLTPIKEMTLKEKVYYCMEVRCNAYRFTACGREANRFLKDLIVSDHKDIPKWVNSVDEKKLILKCASQIETVFAKSI